MTEQREQNDACINSVEREQARIMDANLRKKSHSRLIFSEKDLQKDFPFDDYLLPFAAYSLPF